MRWFEVYCGNLECGSRKTKPPTTFDVTDDQLVDGETFYCPSCRKTEAVA